MAKPGPKPAYRIVTAYGYVALYEPDHPDAWKSGRVLEHRLVMEKHLGRRLKKKEHVHHIDGNRENNDPSNLKLISPEEHTKLHKREESPLKHLWEMSVEKLQDLYDTSSSIRAIAGKYSCDPSSLRYLLRTRGVSLRHPRSSRNSHAARRNFEEMSTDEIQSLYDKNGMAKIGEEHGISAPSIRRILVERGIEIRERGIGPNKNKKSRLHHISTESLEELYRMSTIQEIADFFGCSQSTVGLELKRRGIERRGQGIGPNRKPPAQKPNDRQS